MSKTTKAKPATKSTTKKPGKAAAVASDGQVIASVHVAAAVPPKGKPAAVVAKAAKAPKAAKQSPTAAIRAALAADPTLEADAIAAALAKKGMSPPASTITTVRADFLGCYRALQAAGKVKLH